MGKYIGHLFSVPAIVTKNFIMATQFLLFVLVVTFSWSISSSSTLLTLIPGSSLSVEKKGNVLISSNNLFSAGFYRIGVNAYSFAIWFTEPLSDGTHTIVWMANRDKPVNGKGSKLSLLKNGNLVLTDAGHIPIWETDSIKNSTSSLELMNNGNLVVTSLKGHNLWQSFDWPTDTLLPEQQLTKDTSLISSRSRTNYSSGFYKFHFDEYNILRLLFGDLEVSSIYWPYPWEHAREINRTMYNSSRIAVLDRFGHFKSSDNLEFFTSDFGLGTPRRLAVDPDGNIRVYSLDQRRKAWEVTWQAISRPCRIHGVCGAYSLCSYGHGSGRKCTCIPGYKMKNPTDWSYGCEPDFKPFGHGNIDVGHFGFIQLPLTDFYGYDSGFFINFTFNRCKKECLSHDNCKGFLYKSRSYKGNNLCYIKNRLLNGQTLETEGSMYVKLPTSVVTFYDHKNPLGGNSSLYCSSQVTIKLMRTYKKKNPNDSLKYMLWFTFALGGFEIICILCFLFMQMPTSKSKQAGYLQVATGFRRFSYAELKKATRNFSEEIGRGGSSIVYKGVLLDNRVAAIKQFKAASHQGEAEFLAEISIIRKLNHMNLIEMWGYCAKGKSKFLVYEYLDHGSLAENLSSNALDWEKRDKIVVGAAKGLSYLHEQCLEWVLHCDVKPQNILLNSNYEPKVADFGLSKLMNRGVVGNFSFSKIRGTRGYMAPEWVLNDHITSKVDVYSYGILTLETITGQSPTVVCSSSDDSGGSEQKMLVAWIKEKMQASGERGKAWWIGEIADTRLNGAYDLQRMETLVQVALQCVEDDENARPNMSQVVEMLIGNETDE